METDGVEGCVCVYVYCHFQAQVLPLYKGLDSQMQQHHMWSLKAERTQMFYLMEFSVGAWRILNLIQLFPRSLTLPSYTHMPYPIEGPWINQNPQSQLFLFFIFFFFFSFFNVLVVAT